MNGCGQCHDPLVFGHVECRVAPDRVAWRERWRASWRETQRARAQGSGREPGGTAQPFTPENTCYNAEMAQEMQVISL